MNRTIVRQAAPSEITPEHVYVSRRSLLTSLGALAAGALLTNACDRLDVLQKPSTPGYCGSPRASAAVDELGDPLTDCNAIIGYNNFFEFSFDKEDVGDRARDFKTSPWTVQVGGLVNNPKIYDLDDLRRRYPEEERIYRHRCVEAWSMVIPWLGFPLAALLKEAEPTSRAGYVRFEALYDPRQMPGQANESFKWPYVEGLRLDEAMHGLTLLATGIYGNPLAPQSGAPIRLVVPWKYGFKSIKSIVRIDLVEEMPVSFWVTAAPTVYGFYANINPGSFATERRVGEPPGRQTLLFNGYGDRVASLYEGMDLKKFF